MGESVFDRMERLDTHRKISDFTSKMQMPYDYKIRYATIRAREFLDECNRREKNVHVSVGGLDSITLLCFLRSIYIDVPAISVSFLEDLSIQKIHKQLGVECLKPVQRGETADGKPIYWTKTSVLQEFGFPIISKECAQKISYLQHPTQTNATVRHAIITGETGEYGGNQKNSRMKLAQKWLELFGGADPEGAALGYKAAPFRASDRCCYYLKEKPCGDWARKNNSYPYLGLMASEGGRREKILKINGCNYFGKSNGRSAPFAIFTRQDLLQLALDLHVPVPEIYGTIQKSEDGTLYTTKAQRTGCSMCGFGVHLEKHPNRFERLREENLPEYVHLMYHLVQDENGKWYGWRRIFDYIGVDV